MSLSYAEFVVNHIYFCCFFFVCEMLRVTFYESQSVAAGETEDEGMAVVIKLTGGREAALAVPDESVPRCTTQYMNVHAYYKYITYI